jgi:hypothetical protein
LGDAELVDLTAKFVLHIKNLITDKGIGRKYILFRRNRAIFDHGDDRIINVRGARHIAIRSFGVEKLRVTELLAASSTGRKLLPSVFVNGCDTNPI